MRDEHDERERARRDGAGAAGETADVRPEPSAPASAEEARGDAPRPEERIAALEALLKSCEDRHLYEAAERDNFRKRLQRDKADAVRFANESFARDLLGVLDSLELAVAHADRSGSGRALAEGVDLTLRLFRDVLERHGVKEVPDPTGAPFDPTVHEANEIEETGEVPPNTVVRQRAKGYRHHERLLRPASVVVSRAPSGGANGPERPR